MAAPIDAMTDTGPLAPAAIEEVERSLRQLHPHLGCAGAAKLVIALAEQQSAMHELRRVWLTIAAAALYRASRVAGNDAGGRVVAKDPCPPPRSPQ